MPISDEETSNNESNQNDGPEKDIEIDISDSSDENDGPLKSLLREMLKVSNEEKYPKTFYYIQLLLVNFEEHVNKNGKISAFKANEILNNLNGTNIERNAEDFNLGDDVMLDLLNSLKLIFNNMIIHEEAFYEQFRKGDKTNNGTVSNEYAKEVIWNCKLFHTQTLDDRFKKLRDKYSNDYNQFNYEEMKKNTLNDIELDKSRIYSYNFERKKWVRKYKFTPTYCL
ncbi:uncharacterized protein LOC126895001 isoform X2 [Daktulosphaira vitifoliae]|nr:uncharacterized protein LOC126895001 isoform X2 [Daktulosphaira vitifoliae]